MKREAGSNLREVKPKLPEGTFIDSRAGIYLFLNPSAPTWIFVDQITAFLLLLCDGKRTIREIIKIARKRVPTLKPCQVESRFSALLDSLFFLTVPDVTAEYAQRISLNRIDIVYLYVTNRCNLNCAYCFKKAGHEYANELNTQEIRDFLRDITNLTDPLDTTILFTGGEPLLRSDCFELAEWAAKLGFRVHLNTNGTLIKRKNVDQLKIFERVNVSIDGSSAEIHDELRGKGSFKKVVRGVNLLKESRIRYTLVPTLTKKNYQDSINIIKNLCDGEKTFKTNLFLSAGYGKGKAEELSVNANELIGLSKRMGQVYGSSAKFVESKALRPEPFRRTVGCSLGRTYISLDANGDVYPCQILHDEAFKAGNIRDCSIKKIFEESPTFRFVRSLTTLSNEQCQNCYVRYLCGGGCRARAFHNTGDIKSSDGLCSYWKHLHISAIWATFEGTDQQPSIIHGVDGFAYM